MANPNVQPGTLNRLRASVVIPALPQLNISPSYLLPEGINIAFEGQSTTVLPAMTGVVTSPEPYQLARITVHLIKAQAFASIWKRQQELSTILGEITVRPDSVNLDPYIVNNCSIVGVDRLSLSGRDAGYVVSMVGSYDLNSQLWG